LSRTDRELPDEGESRGGIFHRETTRHVEGRARLGFPGRQEPHQPSGGHRIGGGGERLLARLDSGAASAPSSAGDASGARPVTATTIAAYLPALLRAAAITLRLSVAAMVRPSAMMRSRSTRRRVARPRDWATTASISKRR
jgi:hypothetical protein